MRYKLEMSYDGGAYVGFQSQINGTAIQDVLEQALKTVFQKDLRIVMASRTDSGVHAYHQVVHFDDEKNVDTYRLKAALNSLLPNDIHILKAEVVNDDFHCRYDVERKIYEYRINLGEYDVFLNGYAYQCYFKVDLEKMKEAGKLLVGTHDFTTFNTSPLDLYPNQVRTIYRLDFNLENDLLKIEVEGDGFLRHMVRIIVGTLLDVGRGKKTIEDVRKMIEIPDKKATRRYNIDACGLYLKKIIYK